MTLRRSAPLLFLSAMAAFAVALVIPTQTVPRAVATCAGTVDVGLIGTNAYVDQGCETEQSAAIGAAPSSDTIIACHDIAGCLSQAVNSPGGVAVPHRSTAIQQSQ